MTSAFFERVQGYMHRCMEEIDWRILDKKPLSRYTTMKHCFEALKLQKDPVIVELGTTRSFVDGRYEGCNSDDPKYWEPNDPSKWDFGAGCFTYLAAESLPHATIHTVDLIPAHIERCRTMTSLFSNVRYHVSDSTSFLQQFQGKIDCLYCDTGDMTPIYPTADLALREAKIVVERDLITAEGLILIDDVRSTVPHQFHPELILQHNFLGKAMYSLPYLLQTGRFTMCLDEYQVVLKRAVTA